MQNKIVSYSSVLGVVVANKRKEIGLEQSVMADRMGLSQASYSRLESGKSTFSVDQMFECAQSLNIPAAELFKSVLNTVENLQSSNDVVVQAQPRGNTTKAKTAEGSGVGTFIAGAALGALIIGLAGKSK
ncbi:helix-turn-helix domain-containing protein [Shewanella insulae]|uniref:helix-turn-helix domain-containing protein n=1 Tax=Shewanella TaxID=22 RepID=UPI001AAC4D17|nr:MULTISPECIES: helix-turn-helix transcriptional regulator [Shewanella]MBO2678713.1 helix-turn-helix transcriptional regulator [Shewanella algae]MCG9737685.1 helix-turn-helix domain-containing protein [Shewanella insulae]